MSTPRTASLPRRLLVLALAGLLPVAAFGVSALVLLARQQSAEIERATIQTTRAMIVAIDGELLRIIAVLRTLASSESLRQGDLPRFYIIAGRALRAQPAWATIVLSDPSGTQRVNAVRAFDDTSAVKVSEDEAFKRAIENRHPAFGHVAFYPLLEAPVFTIHVPVRRGNELRYVLTAAIEAQSMLRVLERQRVPTEGLVTIFDRHKYVVARSRAHEKFVGRPVSLAFRELMTGGREGWGPTATLEGEEVYTAYSLSDISEWGVGIGLQRDVIDGPLWRSSLYLAVGIFISLMLGAIAAALVARRIAGPIKELRTAAIAVGRGEQPPRIDSAIPELQDVADALASAAADRDRVEAAREETLRREREARGLAEDANRLKDQFLAMFGHELRNPLAAIMSAAQLLEQPKADRDAKGRAQGVLKRQVVHLTHLVDDLLDVERVMTGKIELVRESVDLADVLMHGLAALRSTGRLDRENVDVQAEPVTVEGDVTRLDQIVTNLLVNAAKYTPPERRITVILAREGEEAVLRVGDEGIGIHSQLLPRIFDLFVQGEAPLDRAQGGLGVGLTLVRRLVELHGGSVAAESAGPGKGSVFTVRLPACAAEALSAASSPPPTIAVPRKILLVEDNDDARIMMRLALELTGHTVHEANDGPDGVRAALQLRPEVALVDLGLPGLDGYEVGRRIRAALGTSIRLVALTGYGLPEDRARSYQSGFDVHLVKPIGVDDLTRALEDDPPVPYLEEQA